MNIQLAKIIDHTNLKPEATKNDIEKLCKEAREYGFASVCVNPCHVAFAAGQLIAFEFFSFILLLIFIH